MSGKIRIRRIYEAPRPGEGPRFWVDRLWPRGKSKEALEIAARLKDVAPSTALRKWFDHEPAKWAEFKKRYFAELRENEEALGPILKAAARGNVTLLYSARDEKRNQAAALAEFLKRKLAARKK